MDAVDTPTLWHTLRRCSVAMILVLCALGWVYLIGWFLSLGPLLLFVVSSLRARLHGRPVLQGLALLAAMVMASMLGIVGLLAAAATGVFEVALAVPFGIGLGIAAFAACCAVGWWLAGLFLRCLDARLGTTVAPRA